MFNLLKHRIKGNNLKVGQKAAEIGLCTKQKPHSTSEMEKRNLKQGHSHLYRQSNPFKDQKYRDH